MWRQQAADTPMEMEVQAETEERLHKELVEVSSGSWQDLDVFNTA